MYCVNCGVKLADTEQFCPLCGVKALHPDVERKPIPSGITFIPVEVSHVLTGSLL